MTAKFLSATALVALFAAVSVDALSNGMLTELDAGKRDAMIAKAWSMLNKEMIYLPLHHQILGWATTDKVDQPIIANDTPQFRWTRLK